MYNEVHKKIRRLAIVGPQPLAHGFDVLEENGIRLMRSLREIFFSCARELVECRTMPRVALFDAHTYESIYSDIAGYRNFFTLPDGSQLVLHDASIQPLLELAREGAFMQAVLTQAPVMREATGGLRPLEKVRYHYEVPTLHVMVPAGQVELGRGLLVKLVERFATALCTLPHIHSNRRDVTHYADWSVSVDLPMAGNPLEIAAGYQLSSQFSRALQVEGAAFFEIAISSRLIVGLVGHYMARMGGRVIFPSRICPVAANVVYASERTVEVLRQVRGLSIPVALFRQDRGGTAPLQRAQWAAMGNGAPISLLLAADSTRILRNIDRNLRPIDAGAVPSEIAAELSASDTLVRRIGTSGTPV